MSEKEPRPDVRFHVEITENSYSHTGTAYANFTARPMILAPSGNKDGRNTLWQCDSYSIAVAGKYRDLTGLEITAQADDHTSRAFYGWNYHYARNRIQTQDAVQILGWLRRVDRRLDTWRQQLGPAQDLVTYCAYVASAVMIPGQMRPFLRQLTTRPEDEDYERNGYRSMDADGLRYWIDTELAAWRKAHNIEGNDNS